jgi:hypothetical protein
MKRVVSVSLGTSKRDKVSEVCLLGERVRLERQGTDGDLARFAARFSELDGQIDCFGLGGCDLAVVAAGRRYEFRQIRRLIAGAKRTPVVDGSGLKHTLERQAVLRLQAEGIVDFTQERPLLVSAVDRFGMAQALAEVGAKPIYGDFLFGVGLPIPLTTPGQVATLGRLLLPIVTKLPFKWFYPTGEKQEKRTPRFPKIFEACDVLCGDWHFIRRYAPDDLRGKTILTQTLRTADLDWLRAAGARRAITTTPLIDGETFATNVMEAGIVALRGPTSEAETLDVLRRLDWKPNVIALVP